MNNCYEIYVGLNDKDYHKNFLIEETVKEDFETFFSKYKIDFSIGILDGGYVHENGGYVIEKTIKLTLIGDYSKKILDNFISALKKRYNQESILLIQKQIQADFRK